MSEPLWDEKNVDLLFNLVINDSKEYKLRCKVPLDKGEGSRAGLMLAYVNSMAFRYRRETDETARFNAYERLQVAMLCIEYYDAHMKEVDQA